MKEEQIKRLEQMQLDCSKCPLSQEDCDWLTVNFGAPYRLSKKGKWCPLRVTIASTMSVLDGLDRLERAHEGGES